jgi:FAD/FMN-containing dehydrogenase/Fe-S oxidoreductase
MSNASAGSPLARLHVLSHAERERMELAEAIRLLGVGQVRFERHDRMLYATDASIFQVEPIGVVVLDRPEAAVPLMRFCAERGLPVLPRGGGTSLAGQCVNFAVMLDFGAHCRGIRAIDPAAMTAVVEPGVTLDQLNAALATHGLLFGPDVATSSHATLGGMIGNNSAGARSLIHGRTVENLLALDVVLPDGSTMHLSEGSCERDPRQRELARRLAAIVLPLRDEIARRVPRIRRHVDGYNVDLLLDQLDASTPGTFDRVNLATLVCGSEGTLATVTSATLRLARRPGATGLAIAGFESVPASLSRLMDMLACGPSAVELVDDVVIDTALANTEYRRYVEVLPKPSSGRLGAVMYVEFQGESIEAVRAGFDRLAAVLPGVPMQRHEDPRTLANAWKLRKAGEPLLHGVPGDRKPMTFVEDTAVDPARLAAFVDGFRAIVERHGTRAAYYAHASVGCLHIRPLVRIHDERGRAEMVSIATEVADLVSAYGGALSGEHGDGRVRTPLLERVMGRELCEGFRRVKEVFDPEGRMNPGNLVETGRPQAIVERLRVKPAERDVPVPRVDTFFHYDREHGFEAAVEACNGAGLCRRVQPGGTMCPSYRATLDERHATRGRGNALRLAITGQFGTPGSPDWRDAQTQATLDLCLSCKACKSECPSNVDISKLKAEFAAQGFARRGRVPWRTRLLGRVRQSQRLGSLLWPLANAALAWTPVRRMITGMLGFHPDRHLPAYGPAVDRWLGRRGSRAAAGAPTVLLFPDCFANYGETDLGRLAVQLLEAFGYRVVMPDVGCCGRSLISVGMLAEARETVARTARSLLEAMERTGAVAVLGLEPSCVSAIKDDWLDLKMDVERKRLRAMAERTWLVEAFLDQQWDRHPIRPAAHPAPSETVILHGHCHQKALWGVESSAGLLRRLVGERLQILDSGCCGLAGSFGYLAHRHELSLRIGELSVFPPIRRSPDAVVAAPGTSCRHQIQHATGAEAMHPVALAARLLLVPAPASIRPHG